LRAKTIDADVAEAAAAGAAAADAEPAPAMADDTPQMTRPTTAASTMTPPTLPPMMYHRNDGSSVETENNANEH